MKLVSSIADPTSFQSHFSVGLFAIHHLQLHPLIDASCQILQLDTLVYVAHIYPLSPPDGHPHEI